MLFLITWSKEAICVVVFLYGRDVSGSWQRWKVVHYKMEHSVRIDEVGGDSVL